MNLNRLVLGDHVEFEANTYYASFTAELEAAAIPMWALVSHLKDEKTRDYTANVLKYCLIAIKEWWDAIHYDSPIGCNAFLLACFLMNAQNGKVVSTVFAPTFFAL